jgi:lipopolysaccharide transport system permease protein
MKAAASSSFMDRFVGRARLVSGFALRDMSTRYAGSYLGVFWAFALPLVSSAVYILVFGMLMKGTLLGETYQRFDFTTFYFLGFAPWLLFSEVVMRATTILRENRSLIRNVQFEHRILPLVAFASATVAHVVILLLCVGLIAAKGYEFSSRFYLLPFYFVILFLLTVGIAYILAALSPYLPDIAQVAPIVLNLLFFTIPILYTPQLVEQMGSPWVKRFLIDLNPLSRIVEGYRLSMVEIAVPVNVGDLVTLAIVSAAVFLIGILVYRHLEKGFADVL